MFKKNFFLPGWVLTFLYGAAVLAVPLKKNSSLCPILQVIATIALITAIFIAVVVVHRRGTLPFPHLWGMACAMTACFANDCQYQVHTTPGVPPLFLLVIFFVGFLGDYRASILTYLVFITIPPAGMMIQVARDHLPVSLDILWASFTDDPWRPGFMAISSIIALLLSAPIRSRRYKPLDHSIYSARPEKKAPSMEPQEMKPGSPLPADALITLAPHREEQGIADLLSSVVYFMSRNFRPFSALGFIYDSPRQSFLLNAFQSKSMNIRKNTAIPLDLGIIGKIGIERKPFMTGDLHVYNSELTYYETEEPINSFLGVPIVADDELLGVLILDSREPKAFKDEDKEIMKRFSTLAAALIKSERRRLYEEKSARISSMLYEASHQFTTAPKIDDVFNVLFHVIPKICECTRQISIECNGEGNTAIIKSVYGAFREDIAPGYRFPIDSRGLYAFVFQKRKELLFPDFQQYADRYFRFMPDEKRYADIRSLAILPIMDNEQRCRGLFSIEADKPDVFTEDIHQVLMMLIDNASVAFGRAFLYEKMERLASIDGLTGLNNHRTFQEILGQEIERSRRYNRPLSLLLLDIDHFKVFNDTYGHPVGDLVLKEIAECIKKSIRQNDIPARYGGEEFVVIIPETSEQGSLITAERIRSTIAAHTIISLERKLNVTVSIGCSAYPETAQSQQALIDTADKALYIAKKGGRNRIVPFENDS